MTMFSIRTPLTSNDGEPRQHAVIRNNSHRLVSVCRRLRASSWRKVSGGAVTCKSCLKVLEGLGWAA